MNRQDVFDVVKRHMLEIIEDLDEEDVVDEGNMKELGANSLDMVEIVSCSMRELRIKVPRADLAELKNIGQLVDLLHRVALAKAA